MSSDAKANTLPKWSYILLAVLLVCLLYTSDAADE